VNLRGELMQQKDSDSLARNCRMFDVEGDIQRVDWGEHAVVPVKHIKVYI